MLIPRYIGNYSFTYQRAKNTHTHTHETGGDDRTFMVDWEKSPLPSYSRYLVTAEHPALTGQTCESADITSSCIPLKTSWERGV